MNNDNDIKNFFEKIIIQTIKNKKKKSVWDDLFCKFSNYKKLEIDLRGSFGQLFLVEAFKKLGYRAYNDNDKNKNWDIKLGNLRIEVKTASLDVNNKFQHEAIHKTNDYNILCFFDIAPNNLYIKFVNYDDIPWQKLHLRGKSKIPTGAGYKWDLKLKDHINDEVKNLNDLKTKINEAISYYKWFK